MRRRDDRRTKGAGVALVVPVHRQIEVDFQGRPICIYFSKLYACLPARRPLVGQGRVQNVCAS